MARASRFPGRTSLGPGRARRTVGEVSHDGNSTLADEVGATLRQRGSHAHSCHMHGGDRDLFLSARVLKSEKREGVRGVGGGEASDKGGICGRGRAAGTNVMSTWWAG